MNAILGQKIRITTVKHLRNGGANLVMDTLLSLGLVYGGMTNDGPGMLMSLVFFQTECFPG